MINLVIGIAIGAAFAPFWMMVWSQLKAWWTAFNAKK